MEPVGLSVALATVIGSVTHAAHGILRDYLDVPKQVKHVENRTVLLDHTLRQLGALPPGMKDDVSAHISALAQMTACPALPRVNLRSRRARLHWLVKDKDGSIRDQKRLDELLAFFGLDMNVRILQKLLDMSQKDEATQAHWSECDEKLGAIERRIEAGQLLRDDFRQTWKTPLRNLIAEELRNCQSRTPMARSRGTRKALRFFTHASRLTTVGKASFGSLQLSFRLLRRVLSLYWKCRGYHLSLPSITFLPQNIIPSDAPPIEACKRGDKVKLEELLANCQATPNDINDRGVPLLYFAVSGGSYEVVDFLLNHGADPNWYFGEDHESVLGRAFYHARPDMVRRLLRATADVDYINGIGWPCVSYIWCRTRPSANVGELLEILSAQGFDAWDSPDVIGWTPVHRAAMGGTSADLELFTGTYGASPTVLSRPALFRPLHCSVIYNNIGTFEYLCAVENPATRAFYPDADGWTLLHYAAQQGNSQILEWLLRLGADLSARTTPTDYPALPAHVNNRSLTARDVAIAYNHGAIFDKAVAAVKST